tara:strand:+ start:14184 stop:15890 length:1707 start_codon:yes stop_codon:yes gene_type:complete
MPHYQTHSDQRAPAINKAILKLAEMESAERGEIFTRSEVVEFILDLSGYMTTKQLWKSTILEPSFGGGDFLKEITKRLLKSYISKSKSLEGAFEDLKDSVRAVELYKPSFENTKLELIELICSLGLEPKVAKKLVNQWLRNDDFLLHDLDIKKFEYVVGNPPYVRQEEIDNALLAEYKTRFNTIYDRADLYVPFIEKGLLLLKEEGSLAFICSDRWMKNKYGGPLRGLVSNNFHLSCFVDMFATDAFHDEVSAYPSIFEIKKETCKGKPTRILNKNLKDSKEFKFKKLIKNNSFYEIPELVDGKEPWILDHPEELKLLREIESKFEKIEDCGCKVGIGVATGNDKVFIRKGNEVDIEKSRKLPLLMAKEMKSGEIDYQGTVLVNPYDKNSKLIDLEKYPKTKRYFEENAELLKKRHVAKKNPAKWYKTIDKVTYELTSREKLLIPDIKGKANIVYDSGDYYPHHNLYFIVSNSDWDLQALQSILKSDLTLFFISKYSLRMRGGYLRYQAQYLRRLRIPEFSSITKSQVNRLKKYSSGENFQLLNELVYEIYGLSNKDQKLITETVKRV